MADETNTKTHKFKAEVTQVLSLVINSLYSNLQAGTVRGNIKFGRCEIIEKK